MVTPLVSSPGPPIQLATYPGPLGVRVSARPGMGCVWGTPRSAPTSPLLVFLCHFVWITQPPTKGATLPPPGGGCACSTPASGPLSAPAPLWRRTQTSFKSKHPPCSGSGEHQDPRWDWNQLSEFLDPSRRGGVWVDTSCVLTDSGLQFQGGVGGGWVGAVGPTAKPPTLQPPGLWDALPHSPSHLQTTLVLTQPARPTVGVGVSFHMTGRGPDPSSLKKSGTHLPLVTPNVLPKGSS